MPIRTLTFPIEKPLFLHSVEVMAAEKRQVPDQGACRGISHVARCQGVAASRRDLPSMPNAPSSSWRTMEPERLRGSAEVDTEGDRAPETTSGGVRLKRR